MPTPQIKMVMKIAICLLVPAVLWHFPISSEIPSQGNQIFSVFLGVIVSFFLRPFAMGPMVLFGLLALVSLNTLSMPQALSGFSDDTVWLVVAAFLISGAVIETGFGKRIALILLRSLGKTVIGSAYAICGAELILGPVVPSNTARGGGVLSPIMRSMAEALRSYPNQNSNLGGEYLNLVGAHANLITAGMFLTGMAANPLISRAASDILGIDFSWGTWAMGGIVPGLIGLLFLPHFLYLIARPTQMNTQDAQAMAIRELKELGPWSREQKWMGFIFVFLLALWSTKMFHGLSTGLVAWIGVSLLIITKTHNWEQMTKNYGAWDCLIWLGGLLTMANSLKEYGFIEWFSHSVSSQLPAWNPINILIMLALIYFFSMYFFSMLTAHISAFIGVFFGILSDFQISPLLVAMLFAAFSNLCGCLTHYSTGPVIIYFGQGYVGVPKWFRVGFFMGLFHIFIWLGFGLMWWKILGWW